MSKTLQALFEGGRLIEISDRDAAAPLPPGWEARALRPSLRPYIAPDWGPHAKEGLGTGGGEALERFRTQLQARLAARRWEAQTQGIEYEGKGWPTDGQSRAAMVESLALAREWEEANPGKPWRTVWKTADGFVTVTRAELLAAAFALGDRIQGAFQREAKLSQKIREGTFETLAALSEELEGGW